MKTIYILLMQTHTWPARAIRFFTRYEYSHVGLSLDKSCNQIYSFGRKKVHSILKAGFTIENKNGEFFKFFNKTTCKIYEVQITEEQYNNLEKIINNMKEHIENYKYDFYGIIPRYFGMKLSFENKFVCSYFVAYVLEQAKICKFNKKTCMVKPEDFKDMPGFKEIYNGKYLLYT